MEKIKRFLLILGHRRLPLKALLKGSNRNIFTVKHLHVLWLGHDQTQRYT